MDNLIRDLRFALRVMAKRPAVTAAAVLCLGLTIGATTVVYSMVDGVLLRPLPYDEPDRLLMVNARFLKYGQPRAPLSGLEFQDLLETNQSFEALAGLTPWYYNLTEGENPERLVAARVSSQTFAMLGSTAEIGRTFDPSDAQQNQAVAVLSHDLWQRRFEGDEGVIGRAIQLDQQPYTVIGVMPKSFRFLTLKTDIWVPLVINQRIPRHIRHIFGVDIVGRLKPGVSVEQAQAELQAIGASFAERFPDQYPPAAGFEMVAKPFFQVLVQGIRPMLLALLAAVTLVLLIGCTNVANLLLSQATTREREISLRAALGAGRWRLLRQGLTESVLLGLMGGVVGVLLARWGLAALKASQGAAIPRLHQIEIDGRILAFALGVSVLTGIVFGLVPAVRGARTDLFGLLKEGGKTSADANRHPLRNALVVLQIALALVLLIGSGLMIRSLQQLQRVDPGFQTQQVLSAQLFLARAQYPTQEARSRFSEQLIEEVIKLPGVESAGLVSNLPLSRLDTRGDVLTQDRVVQPGDAAIVMGWRSATPDYFEAMGIPLLQGRTFSRFDRGDAEAVAIVDAAAAQRLWPDGSALDQRIKLGEDDTTWRRIVGIVGSVQNQSMQSANNEHVYVPLDQRPAAVINLAVRAAGAPMDLVPGVRSALRTVDPIQPISNIKTTAQLVEDSLAQPRFNRMIFGLFGTAALLLAGIGVYSVMAYSVAQRRRELGLRMALGAQRGDNLRMVMASALRLAAIGVIGGLVVAGILSRVLSNFMARLVYGVDVLDVATFVAVPAGLLALSVIASAVPAWNATRVRPMESLRDD